MPVEYRILGPLEASRDGGPARLGGRRQRAVLAVLLLHAGGVVAADELIEEVWPEAPPETATNLLQGYVSELRKELGREAIETREPGYRLQADREAIDLHRFERLATEGRTLLADGRPEAAAELLRDALALWRGPALADLVAGGVLGAAALRLDELRLAAQERRIEAELACGRHVELLGELEAVVAAQPLREHPRALLMLALFRAGRQADALAAYRAARATLVDELGIEPGGALQELERRILLQDPALSAPSRAAPVGARERPCVLVCVLAREHVGPLVTLGKALARDGELLLAATTPAPAELAALAAWLSDRREGLVTRGTPTRAAAFTSLAPGGDLARLAHEQEADLVLVDAPLGLLDDPPLRALLADAPCDVAIVTGGELRPGPVVVPFTGTEHDWAAVELGAWLARSRGARLRLAGARTGISGRDASRLLANASLAVQRALDIDARPLLVDPRPDAVVAAAADASAVVVGLTDRWRRDGLGPTRLALATSPAQPTLLVRRGLRPGGLAGRERETRFTWTVGPTSG